MGLIHNLENKLGHKHQHGGQQQPPMGPGGGQQGTCMHLALAVQNLRMLLKPVRNIAPAHRLCVTGMHCAEQFQFGTDAICTCELPCKHQ